MEMKDKEKKSLIKEIQEKKNKERKNPLPFCLYILQAKNIQPKHMANNSLSSSTEHIKKINK